MLFMRELFNAHHRIVFRQITFLPSPVSAV